MKLNGRLEECLRGYSRFDYKESFVIYLELFASGNRLYSSNETPDTVKLVNRFFVAHGTATVSKGGKKQSIPITDTGMVIRFPLGTRIISGMLWENGAIILSEAKENDDDSDTDPILCLFVDDKTAKKWQYPDGYRRLPTVSKITEDVGSDESAAGEANQ